MVHLSAADLLRRHKIVTPNPAAGDLALSGLWDHELSTIFESLTASFFVGGGLTLFSNGAPLLFQYVAAADSADTSFPLLRQRNPSQATSWTLSSPDTPATISVEERDARTIRVGTPTQRQLLVTLEAQAPLSPFEQWLATLDGALVADDGAAPLSPGAWVTAR